MLTVTGSPVGPFVKALRATLLADTVLLALLAAGANSLLTALPLRTRSAYPYLVIGDQELGPSDAAMQIEGGQVAVTLDIWSDENSPAQTWAILSRVRALLHRRDVDISGYALVRGSLTCELEQVMTDSDPDIPERGLFHGTQRWTAWVEESL